MYFVRTPDVTLVGSSPEPMVQLLDGRVISPPDRRHPAAGRTDEDDRRLAAELTEHPKERAEHVMLVDLARNDVGRVVEFGTVHVDELMTLERYSHVMHLTSQVSGALATGRTPMDVLRATLPAGTVSGAPKVRAMEIIDELEPTKRGPYAGVVGYLDFSGNLDTAIAIRTMVWRRRPGSVQAGAGIVADSDARRRGPGVPQQGGRPAGRRARRPAHAGEEAMTEGYRALTEDVGLVELRATSSGWTGRDAAAYLQGQLSQDLDAAAAVGGERRRPPCSSPRARSTRWCA